jgi:hypothetical protein
MEHVVLLDTTEPADARLRRSMPARFRALFPLHPPFSEGR